MRRNMLALVVRALMFTLVLASPAGAARTPEQLDEKVNDLDRLVELVVLPMTLLIAVLSLGGIIGIVFSIRDQRRISQLHELAVSSEMSSQRRTEQSFTAFLEESQKTLTLVNDTLTLAKQATESERQAMERKAETNLGAIEEKAEDLILRVAENEDFDELLDVRDYRAEVQLIAHELAQLEAYRRLQDIDLPPYSRFLMGIEQYLDNKTDLALRTLRHATEDTSKPQLQRMALYWAAKLNAAVGNYDSARGLLARAIEDSQHTHIAWLEYERLRCEVELFGMPEPKQATPRKRYEAVAGYIEALIPLAQQLAERTKLYEDQHPNHEMVATLANFYMWIAYDRARLYTPLVTSPLSDSARGDLEKADPDGLGDDELRVWAVLQARNRYPKHDAELHDEQEVDFALRFGREECDFALGTGSARAYHTLESHAAADQAEGHREYRHTIELAQIALICDARELYLLTHGEGKSRANADVEQARNDVEKAYAGLTNGISGAPDHNITVFSHLERRNLSLEHFRLEARDLRDQALGLRRKERKPGGNDGA